MLQFFSLPRIVTWFFFPSGDRLCTAAAAAAKSLFFIHQPFITRPTPIPDLFSYLSIFLFFYLFLFSYLSIYLFFYFFIYLFFLFIYPFNHQHEAGSDHHYKLP